MQTAPYLLGQFREFAADLIELREPAGRDATDPGSVWGMAVERVERRMGEARRDRDRAPAEAAFELPYAMAALADETFLHLDWKGSAYWRAHLVETHLFGTRAAGQRIFERIDGILAADSAGRAGMAAVYLLLLGLGFRGRFASAAGAAEIERRRAALSVWIGRKSPGLLGDLRNGGSGHVTAEAYAHTVADGVVTQLPTPARWWGVAAAVPLLWLGGSFYVWGRLTADVMARIDAVERRFEPGGMALPSNREGAHRR